MPDIKDLISEWEMRIGIPDGLLLACAKVESDLDPDANRHEQHLDDVSLGLLQILTSTARQGAWLDAMGLDPVDDPTDLLDPETNIIYGGAYLRHQYDKFPEIKCLPGIRHDRWRWAVSAYNGGRKNANLALAAGRRRLGMSIDEPGLWCRFWFSSAFLGEETNQSYRLATWNRIHVSKVWAAWDKRAWD